MPENAEKWYTEAYQKTPNYSQIIEALASSQEERVNLLRPFFEASIEDMEQGFKVPTAAHRKIAQLVVKGYLKVIVTTNFDRLMENALKEIGIEATIISNPTHIENVMPLVHSPITIVKIHGDYLDTKFLNIESELTAYDPRLSEYLQNIFENFGLIVCGWSAIWDAALRASLAASNKFRFANYFTYLNKCEGAFKELALRRQAKEIQISSADVFFTDLVKNIEALESGMSSSPLLKPIALARLKKYIVKDESKVQLFELINEVVDINTQFISAQSWPKPDEETIRASIETRLAKLDLTIALITQGIFWGNESHHFIWFKVIAKYAHPPVHRSGWALWTSLSYMEAHFLFYAAGLSALEVGDYAFLKKLFSISIENPYRDGQKVNIMNQLFGGGIIDKDTLNGIYKTNKILPLNELVYETVAPYFSQWKTSDSYFDELFDSFELLVSLFFIKHLGKAYFPKGRFIYRLSSTNIIYLKKAELDERKEEMNWVKEGLFDNYNELLGYYTIFEEEIKNTRFY